MANLTYYVVGPSSGWSDPTGAEIVAGHLSGGGASTAHGSEASLGSTGDHTFSGYATGLADGTSYKTAYVEYDGTTYSNVAVSDAWITGYVLSAGTGNFALTGNSAAFKQSFSLASASYALSGIDVSFGIKLPVSAGAFALTGNDAILAATGVSSYTMTAGTESFAVTGNAAAFNTSLSVASGSFNLTGNDSAFGQALTAEAGNYSITGNDVNLIAGVSYTMQAETGVFLITGNDANLLAGGQTQIHGTSGYPLWAYEPNRKQIEAEQREHDIPEPRKQKRKETKQPEKSIPALKEANESKGELELLAALEARLEPRVLEMADQLSNRIAIQIAYEEDLLLLLMAA